MTDRSIEEIRASVKANAQAAPEPPTPLDPSEVESGALLLDEVRTFLRRFVAFPSESALVTVTLWVAMTHAAERLYILPRLVIKSAEKGSGKTRLLEVLALLVPRPFFTFSASVAALFRTLASAMHTLLVDELDTIFTKRKDDGNEDLRALLNVGYKRGATIPRCEGPLHTVRKFDVTAPAACACIGDAPETIESRAHIIQLRKRKPSETVEPFRGRVQEPEGELLRQRLTAWVAAHLDTIAEAWPDMPHGVVDRPAETWEPLLAVADAAGGHWPATARAACLEMLKVAQSNETSYGVRLLADLREVFGAAEVMSTADVIQALNALEEAPWSAWNGERGIRPRELARLLRPYEVRTMKVKVRGAALQGLRRDHLLDAWLRYLPPLPDHVEPPEPPEPSPSTREKQVPHENQGSGTSPAPVPEVPEPQKQVEPENADSSGKVPQVPQVPLPRPVEEAHDLLARAAVWHQALEGATPDELDTLRTDNVTPHTPEPWTSTALTEPANVTIATLLIREDVDTGQYRASDKWQYLKAAREAMAAIRKEPR